MLNDMQLHVTCTRATYDEICTHFATCTQTSKNMTKEKITCIHSFRTCKYYAVDKMTNKQRTLANTQYDRYTTKAQKYTYRYMK